MSASPLPAPAAAPSCPACHHALAPTDRFCPGCGAPVAAPSPPIPSPMASSPAPGAPPTPAAPPVDIRQGVEGDRGFLKRLQLLIPGFRGYRQGEDLREADSILRLQVADRIHAAVGVLTQRRSDLASSGQYDRLTELSQVLADLLVLEGKVRHAEQGYTGISPASRITVDRQDKLYEYDYGFVLAADDLTRSLSGLSDVSAPAETVRAAIADVRDKAGRLKQAFEARVLVVEQVAV